MIVHGEGSPGHVGDFYEAVSLLFPDELTVYVGSVPAKPEYPYAVLWGDFGDEVGSSLADLADELHMRFRVTYVGLRWDAVAWVVSRVRPALNRVSPVVGGWLVGKLRQSSLMDMQTDFDVKIPGVGHPVYAVDEFALIAHRH